MVGFLRGVGWRRGDGGQERGWNWVLGGGIPVWLKISQIDKKKPDKKQSVVRYLFNRGFHLMCYREKNTIDFRSLPDFGSLG